MTTLRFVGAYRVVVPVEERRAAMKCHDGDIAQVEAELSSAVLIELEVLDAEQHLALEMFHQAHSDCVPYNEEYFDPLTLVHIDADQYKSPDREKYRVAFHLHYYDPAQLLITPYGTVAVGEIAEPPAHLANKRYVYWE